MLDVLGAAAGAAVGAPPLQLPALLSAASWLMIATGAVTFVCLTVLRLRAPYGKYAGDARGGGWGPAVPARLAWFLQEVPALAANFLAHCGAEPLRDDGVPAQDVDQRRRVEQARYAHGSISGSGGSSGTWKSGQLPQTVSKYPGGHWDSVDSTASFAR